MSRAASYGCWDSALSASRVATASVSIGGLAADADAVYWIEGRPAEGGRAVVVRWREDTGAVDVTPPPWSARTRVHEYGGGAFAVAARTLVFSHLPDQRLYRLAGDGRATPLTPAGPWRFADGVIDGRRRMLFCVGEHHAAGPEPENCLVRVPLDREAPPVVVARGYDFYAAPRLHPGGDTLAWLAWRHPDMPWDGTELWTARVDAAGDLREARRVGGGRGESILEPAWAPDGRLHFVSDRTGWWNLYRLGDGGARPLAPREAECARPPWNFGLSHQCVLDDGALLFACAQQGRWRLWRVDPAGGAPAVIDTPSTEIGWLRAVPGGAVFVGASPTERPAVIRIDLRRGGRTVLSRAGDDGLDPALVAVAEPFACRSAGGRVTHGLHYAPHNPAYAAAGQGAPPCIVRCHGGPTAAASAALDPAVQFWTSRGFAVLEVNYAGSSGYGRAYRQLLDGAWGVADVEDVVSAARHAVDRGWARPRRLAVRGSSAGGFTVLCALAFHDVFAAGASYYGIGDLEALRRETHKFESYYDQRLIGPYPEHRERYRARSPLHAADRIRSPVIFFQGLDDRVVPPGQADAMAGALRARGVRVEHVTFAGEGHGFRRADTLERALEHELAFYREVLDLGCEIP